MKSENCESTARLSSSLTKQQTSDNTDSSCNLGRVKRIVVQSRQGMMLMMMM